MFYSKTYSALVDFFLTSGLGFKKVGSSSFTVLNPQKQPLAPEAVSIVMIESEGRQVGELVFRKEVVFGGEVFCQQGSCLRNFFLVRNSSAGNSSSEFVFTREFVFGGGIRLRVEWSCRGNSSWEFAFVFGW